MKKIIFFLVLAFIFIPIRCEALTVSQIKTEIRRAMQDTDATNQRYSDTVLIDLINQGQREIVNMTWLAEKTTSYALTARTTYYNLPMDFLATNQVVYTNPSGQNIKIDQASRRSLYQDNPQWERQGGTPYSYYVSIQTAPAATSSSTLRISYIPVPTISTGSITIWYYNQLQDLAADSDIPFEGRLNLAQYHYALVYYAVMRLKIYDGITDEMKIYSDLYQLSVATLKDRTGQMPDYNPSFKPGGR